MSTTQKQAVITAVVEVLGSSFVPGQTNVREIISTDQKQSVRDLVFTGIQSGSVEYSKDRSDSKELRKYVNGLVDNHFRKAKELNGGASYAPTTTRGPRTVTKDEQISTMRTLQKTYAPGSSEFVTIENQIAKRSAELANQSAA